MKSKALYFNSAFLPIFIDKRLWEEQICGHFQQQIAVPFFKNLDESYVEKMPFYLDIFESKNDIAIQNDAHFLDFVYEKVLLGIRKDRGQVIFEPCYSFCFDENICQETRFGQKYVTLRLGNLVLLYYLLIPPKEIIAFLKQKTWI